MTMNRGPHNNRRELSCGLEAKSPKPRCLQGCGLSGGSREESFLVVSGSWHSWACGCITQSPPLSLPGHLI